MAACQDYSRSVVGGSDEVKDILCEPCEQDGRRTEAEGFCVDCSEYLCRQCYKNHKLFKAFRNHVLQDKSNMPHIVTGVDVKDTCLTKCDLHSDKVIEYLCGSCDKLGCTTCITLDHRQCEKVEHIPKIVKAPNISQDFKIILQKVDILSQQVQDKRSKLQSMSGTTDTMRKMAKKELNNQRAEINKFFDELGKEMDKKIDEIHISNTAAVTAASKTYDTIDKDLADFKTKITTKQKAGQRCEAYVAMKLSVTDIDAIERKCQNMEAGSKILKYKLLPSPQVKDMKKNVTEICRLEIETLMLDQSVKQDTGKQQLPVTTLPSKIQHTTKKTTQRPDLSTSKSPRLSMKINVGTTSDKERFYVNGVTMIHEHYIVVADRNNNSIKVIDIRNNKVTSGIVIGETLRSVTTVEKCKVAAILNTKIQFLTVSKSGLLSKDYTINTEPACFDAVYNNKNLIVTTGLFIQIIDMQGSIIKTFNTDSEGKSLFSNCFGLAISQDHETIYASDYQRNTVTSMTMEGKVKAIYRDNDLKNPWGITVDNEDNVYVCSTGTTRNVHQLSADCTKLQVFQDTGGICITCTNTNKLVAGGSGSLTMFDIQ